MSNQDPNLNFDDIPVKDSTGKFSVVSSQGSGPAVAKSAIVDEQVQAAAKAERELGLSWSDEVLERRFKNIVAAYLKEIRNEVQTHDALSKGLEVGGLGLPEAKVDQVISWLKKQKSSLSSGRSVSQPVGPVATKVELPASIEKKADVPPMIKVPEPVVVPQAEPKVAAAVTPIKSVEPVKRFTETELEHEIAPPTPVLPSAPTQETKILAGLEALVKPKVTNVKSTAPAAQPVAAAPVKPPVVGSRGLDRQARPYIKNPIAAPGGGFMESLKSKFKLPVSAPATATTVPAAAVVAISSRDKITDIKAPTRLIGPLDELQNFKLADFRQLNPDPLKAALKIKDKIDLLETQSFSKRIEGITAWQRSEVNRLYLALGKESVEQKRTLDSVIEGRQRQNQPVLTKAELLALAKLNKMLEY